MAGRLYWSKCLPLILANATTINAAFAADKTLQMYANRYYYRRWANMRASMGGGAMPFVAEADAMATDAVAAPTP